VPLYNFFFITFIVFKPKIGYFRARALRFLVKAQAQCCLHEISDFLVKNIVFIRSGTRAAHIFLKFLKKR
jgi:hypothetical protein